MSSMRWQLSGRGLSRLPSRADGGLGGGDDLLADAVDRRIGDLGEELLEIIVKELRLVGEHGERGVGAHRADGFDAVAGHGRHEQPQLLEGVAEGLLALEHGLVVGLGQLRGVLDVGELDHVLVEPLAVRVLGGDRCS